MSRFNGTVIRFYDRDRPPRYTPRMSLFSPDTTPEAARVLRTLLRRTTAARGVRMTGEMHRTARELAAAGVRARRPDLDAAAVRREVERSFLGDDLFREFDAARRRAAGDRTDRGGP